MVWLCKNGVWSRVKVHVRVTTFRQHSKLTLSDIYTTRYLHYTILTLHDTYTAWHLHCSILTLSNSILYAAGVAAPALGEIAQQVFRRLCFTCTRLARDYDRLALFGVEHVSVWLVTCHAQLHGVTTLTRERRSLLAINDTDRWRRREGVGCPEIFHCTIWWYPCHTGSWLPCTDWQRSVCWPHRSKIEMYMRYMRGWQRLNFYSSIGRPSASEVPV